MQRWRAEFYKLEEDQETKEQVEMAVGYVEFIQWKQDPNESMAGLAYRRAPIRLQSCSIVKLFPL